MIHDCIIIGGGVLGAFHAYHAVRSGMRVLVLEKNSKPSGATVQNFGQVVPSGLDTQWQRFGRESLEIYKSIQQQFDISVRQLGSTYLASDDEELTLIEELHDINRHNGYESQLLTARQCLSRFPRLQASYCRGGLFFPGEISVDPRLMIHRLWQFLAQSPLLDFRSGMCAVHVETNDQGDLVSVATSCGQRFDARLVIICSGSDLQTLFPNVYRTSELSLVKLQMVKLQPQRELDIQGNVLSGLSIRRYESFAECPSWRSVKDREAKDSFAKKWGVHILFKQETNGSIILGDSHEYLPVSMGDGFPGDLRTDINQFFVEEALKIFNLENTEIESAWAGVYCQTENPSGIFRHEINDRIHVVTGIGGKGMTSSAGFAKHNLQSICSQIEIQS